LDLDISVTYYGDGDEISVISGKGYIDTTTILEIENTLTEQIARNKFKLIIDLKDINYVSSSGWGLFLREINELRDHNGDIVLANMTLGVYDIYDQMDLIYIIKSFGSIEEAVANFIKP